MSLEISTSAFWKALRLSVLLSVELRADVVEGGAEAVLHLLQAGDDANAYDRSDEAIFDSRCTRLVLHETRKHVHSYSPKLTQIDPIRVPEGLRPTRNCQGS